MSSMSNVVAKVATNSVASQTVAYSSLPAANEIQLPLSGSLGDLRGCIETDRLLPESALPREFRARIHKMFDRIEREFEREYQKLCAENYALQEKLEKFEESEHLEPSNFSKKSSQLSHRIKQQYKQSTFKFVSSLRQPPTNGCLSLPSTNSPGLSSSNQPTAPNALSTSVPDRNPSGAASSSSGGGGSWKFVHRFVGHRDGIWEVSCFRQLVATASADTTVRLWSNSPQANCLMIYSGHSGSVNSVRFREANQVMLTASGDGTAHLIKLPQKFFEAHTFSPSSSSNTHGDLANFEPFSSTAVVYPIENAHEEDDGTTTIPDLEVSNEAQQPTGPMILRDPSSVFQSATLTFPSSLSGGVGGGESSHSGLDSSPVAAADFLSGCDQIVTGSWDRLGRLYDLNTGQEVQSLAGHEYQLTDVRAADNNLPIVVTSARDSTFRVWDLRSPCLGVHVQQAHSRTVSTTQFLPGSTDYLISAGTDRFCRLWDLRNARSPLFAIRTDAGINRLAISRVGVLQEVKQSHGTLVAGEGCGQLVEASGGLPSSSALTATSTAHLTVFPCVFALPMNNRSVRFIDITGSRIGRIPRNIEQGHTRAITSAAWAEDGLCNLFTAGFDHQLLGWQLQVP